MKYFFDLRTFFSTKVKNSTESNFFNLPHTKKKKSQTSIGPKYVTCYLNNEVRVHTFGLAIFTGQTELKSSSPFIALIKSVSDPFPPNY